MADNYLERKMEEYRHSRQGAAVTLAHPHSSRVKAGEALIPYPCLRILVTDGMSEAGQAIIRTMRMLNCRVAFTASSTDNRTQCTRFAQDTGSQYHPTPVADAIEYLRRHDDTPAAIIDLDGTATGVNDGIWTVPIPANVSAHGADSIAAWCGYALSPDGRITIE